MRIGVPCILQDALHIGGVAPHVAARDGSMNVRSRHWTRPNSRNIGGQGVPAGARRLLLFIGKTQGNTVSLAVAPHPNLRDWGQF
jgi:hypothetical protein